MGSANRLRKYKLLVHPYSGLDPESWLRFINNLHNFEELDSLEKSANSLYSAIDNIRDIALGTRRADDSQFKDDLNLIATNLGIEGETILNQQALNKGLRFFPKYLNNSFIDWKKEDWKVSDDGPVKSHGQ
jgi:hypothetical protein